MFPPLCLVRGPDPPPPPPPPPPLNPPPERRITPPLDWFFPLPPHSDEKLERKEDLKKLVS